MSVQSSRLDAEIRALTALAGTLESLLERPRRLLHRMTQHRDLVGPLAEETDRELRRSHGMAGRMAGDLLKEAAARAHRSAWMEDRDSVGADVEDFVTGRDRTPWS